MASGIRDQDYTTLAGFRHELRRFLRFSQEAAEGVGLKPQQHQALLSIRGSSDQRMTIGELADHLLLKRHSVSGLVDRLEGLGLVQRVADHKDGRVVTVSLTPKAEELLASLSAAHRAELRRIRPLLTGLLESL
jgi:DNA-binding MarR family transcriptional regulator